MQETREIEAVVTSYNQETMLGEAVRSLCAQTLRPARIIVVDDGSTEENSLAVLKRLQADTRLPVPVQVVRQANGGVSAARNTGIREAQAPMVLVLDGDDRLEPRYIERVLPLLQADSGMVAASAWMRTFGVLNAVVRPGGGKIGDFLARNSCPATHILRRAAWEKSGGYDETMRSGFEDWDFFLSLLQTAPDAHIGIVPEPLIDYRTAPASSNIKSMEKRLTLIRYLIRKYLPAYQAHVEEAVLGVEAASIARLYGWESEMCRAAAQGEALAPASAAFLESPTYGDGGIAAAVRVVSAPGGRQ